MTTTRNSKNSSGGSTANRRNKSARAALLRSLVPTAEKMVKMHPMIPASCRDILQVLALRRRTTMIEIVREVMVEYARVKEAEMIAEVKALEVTKNDVEKAKRAEGR